MHESLGRIAVPGLDGPPRIEVVPKSEREYLRDLRGPWLSGREENDGAQYPTTGGLRVGRDRPGKICMRRHGTGSRLRDIDQPEADGQVSVEAFPF